MAKKIQLLLLESIENLGIVGDTVRVRPGFARNYLLPQRLAEIPTPKRIEALKEARSRAQAELAQLRSAREGLLQRMSAVAIGIVRSCNDQGALYDSVTQRDIADALQEAGYDVSDRSVRLRHSIRRIGEFTVPIQFEKDLRTEITVSVKPDRVLEGFAEETAGEAEQAEEPAAEGEAAAEKPSERKPRRRSGRPAPAEAEA